MTTPPGVNPDHAHGAVRDGEPADSDWCRNPTCLHRAPERGAYCPVCIDDYPQEPAA